jgi:LCP family protein required for cell wall assembly
VPPPANRATPPARNGQGSGPRPGARPPTGRPTPLPPNLDSAVTAPVEDLPAELASKPPAPDLTKIGGAPADREAADRPPGARPGSRRPGSNAARAAELAAARRKRKVLLGVGRSAMILLSVFALAATGFAWATLEKAQGGMVTADVLDQGAGEEKPPDGSVDILLVGMDSRTDAKGNPLPAAELDQLHAGEDTGELDTDTMILLHIPSGGGQAMGVSIPRDSWVNIPGYGKGKINSAYGLAKNAAARKLKAQGVTGAQLDVQSNQAGAKESIQTVEALTGVGIDHYAAVNLMGFYQISNAIGGVPVCLKQAVDDTKWSGAKFPAGQFQVQGVQALEFVRQRHNIPGGSTDLEREQRQQAFMASMSHKILSKGTLTSPGTLNSLIGAIQGAVTIDNKWNLIDFAQQMSGMSSGSLKFQTVPVVNIDYWPYGQGAGKPSAVEVNPAAVAAFVRGTTGAPPLNGTTDTSGSQSQAPTGNGAITVDVSNASGKTGLAANVENALVDKGFSKGDTGDVSHRTASILYYSSGEEANAQSVADALNGKFTLEEGPSVPSGHVWIYVGKSYKGLSSATGAAADLMTGSHGVTASNISAGIHSQTGPLAAATPSTTPTAPATPTGGTQPITDAGGPPCIN